MVVRKTSRREVRLDEEHERRLEAQLRRRDITFAAWVREQIDDREKVEAEALARRLEAASRLTSMNIDFGWDAAEADPATRIINEAYDEAIMSQFKDA